MAVYTGKTIRVSLHDTHFTDAEVQADLGGVLADGDVLAGCVFVGMGMTYRNQDGTGPPQTQGKDSGIGPGQTKRMWLKNNNVTLYGCRFYGCGLIVNCSGATIQGCSWENNGLGSEAYSLSPVGATGCKFQNLSFQGCCRAVYGLVNSNGSITNCFFDDITIYGSKNEANSGEGFNFEGFPMVSVALVPPATRSGGVTTYTTSGGTSIRVGDVVRIAGFTDSSFNGDFTVTQVVSSTQFKVSQSGPNASSGGTSPTVLPHYGVRDITVNRLQIYGHNSVVGFWAVRARNVVFNRLQLIGGASFQIFASDAGDGLPTNVSNVTVNNSEIAGWVYLWSRNRLGQINNVSFVEPLFVCSRPIGYGGYYLVAHREEYGVFQAVANSFFSDYPVFRDAPVYSTPDPANYLISPWFMGFCQHIGGEYGTALSLDSEIWRTGRPMPMQYWSDKELVRGFTVIGPVKKLGPLYGQHDFEVLT